MVLILTVLFAHLALWTGEPRANVIKVPLALLTALLWCSPLWVGTCAFWLKFKYPIAFAILLTGSVTTLVMVVYGFPMLVISGIFHVLLTVDVLTRGRSGNLGV